MRNQRANMVLAPRAGFEPATIRLTVVRRGFLASAIGPLASVVEIVIALRNPAIMVISEASFDSDERQRISLQPG